MHVGDGEVWTTSIPSTTINEDDLKDVILDMRQYQPFCGVSMVWGNHRARGIKVTREKVGSVIRMIKDTREKVRSVLLGI